MVVQHSLLAMNANRMLNINVRDQKRASEKLSSGYRINRAADDAAGLAISEKMRRQVRGLTQATDNAQDGISLLQSAEGAMNEIHEMLQRMNELCVKAANDTLTFEDRSYIQSEINELQVEIDRTGATTTFNELKVLNGIPQEWVTPNMPDLPWSGITGESLRAATSNDDLACYSIRPLQSGDILSRQEGGQTVYYAVDGAPVTQPGEGEEPIQYGTIDHPYPISKSSVYRDIANALMRDNVEQTGSVSVQYRGSGDEEGNFYMEYAGPLELILQVGSETDNEMMLSINPVNCSTLELWDVNVEDRTGDGALRGIECVKNAIELNSRERSNLGAYQNRLEHTVRNLENVTENTQDAESTIRDTEMASEMVDYSNRNILMQAGQMMLAQANQTNQGVLSLLQ